MEGRAKEQLRKALRSMGWRGLKSGTEAGLDCVEKGDEGWREIARWWDDRVIWKCW